VSGAAIAHGIGINIGIGIVDMEAIKLLLSLWLLLLLSKCNKFVSLLRGATEKKVIVVGGPAGCCGVVACSWNLLLAVCILIAAQLSQAAPPSSSSSLSSSTETTNETAWPPMHHYDIWSADLKSPSAVQQLEMDIDLIGEEELPSHEQLLLQDDNDHDNTYQLSNFSSRQPKGKFCKVNLIRFMEETSS